MHYEFSREKVEGFSRTKFCQSAVIRDFDSKSGDRLFTSLSQKGLSVCARGFGISYADMILNHNNAILDLKNLNKVLSWSKETGLIRVQGGVPLGKILEIGLPHGWVLNACPGSPNITVGGAISNNVHGKDSLNSGNFGSQIVSLKLLTATGEIQDVEADINNNLYRAIVGGIGLLGIILEVTLQLTSIPSPFLEVKTEICENIDQILQKLDEEDNFPFKVAWCDAFAKGKALGRGYLSKANWESRQEYLDPIRLKKSLNPSSKVFNLFPSGPFWYVGRPFFRPITIRQINRIHYFMADIFMQSNKNNPSKSTVFSEYNFVHNKLPNMNDVYRPYGFIEIQPIIPRSAGHEAVRELLLLCQKEGWESMLCGVKRHSADPFMLSFQGDGYSLGIDVSLRGKTPTAINKTSKKIFDFILECGGKVYLAKDELLPRASFEKMYPEFDLFRKTKNDIDPAGFFMSDMARRLMF